MGAICLSDLAWLLATTKNEQLRDGKKAVELATRACELTEFKAAPYLDTLAGSHAALGNFDEAVKWQRKAIESPDAFAPSDLEQARERLKLYEDRKPFVEK